MKPGPPHPARTLRSSPPSPARGEGSRPGVETGARDRIVSTSATGTKPSPLVGEGGGARSATPGEGAGARAAEKKKRKRVVREPVAFARRLRVNATDAETKLWASLREQPFSEVKFRRQMPIGPYVADFLSYKARLVIELDGGQHADSVADRRRDAWFRGEGFRVLRFWNSDVMRNAEGVLDRIHRYIEPGAT